MKTYKNVDEFLKENNLDRLEIIRGKNVYK